MSNLSGYPTRSFKESQKFLVQDPSTGTASLVLGSDLVDYITPRLNYVIAETTRVAAENTDYDVGEIIQTTGATAPGDNFAAVYLVVEGGTGDFPMINGNDLLIIRGDEFLREQLISNDSGDGSDLVTYTGNSQTVTEALDSRTINLSSVAESFSGLTGVLDYQYNAASWHEGGPSAVDPVGGGIFVFKSGLAKSNHNGGTIISPTVPALSEQAGADEDARLQNFLDGAGETDPSGTGCFVRVWEKMWMEYFGAKGDNTQDTTIPYTATKNYIGQFSPSPSLGGTASTIATPINTRQAQYLFKTTATIGGYAFFKGNNTTFSAPADGRIFTSTNGYRFRFEEITFYGDDIEALYADLPNLENAKFEFIRCDFSTYTVTADRFSVYLKSRSSRVVFDECQVRVSPNFLEVEADFIYISGGWIAGYGPNPSGNNKPEDSESIRINSGSRFAEFRDLVLIPEPNGATRQDKARWISNYAADLSFNNVRFGGENAGIPIVYQFESGGWNSSNRSQNSIISFKDCTGACGGTSRTDSGVIVLQNNVLPGWYLFNNMDTLSGAPLISAAGYDYAGTEETRNAALQAELDLIGAVDKINTRIRYRNMESTNVPDALKTFIDRETNLYKRQYQGPSIDVAHSVIQGLKGSANVSGNRSFTSFKVDIKIAYIQTGPRFVSQTKTYLVETFSNGPANIESKITQIDFNEYETTTSGAGDTVISLTESAGASGTEIQFEVFLASTNLDGGVDNMEIAIRDFIRVADPDSRNLNLFLLSI